jgi:hypothetical protein
MAIYRTTFTVSGAFPFPVDMLRYDRCMPATERDSYELLHSINREGDKPWRVTLIHQGPMRTWLPTNGRWSSFMWSVDPQSVVTDKQ